MDKTFVIFWRTRTATDTHDARVGMTRVTTPTKRAALKFLRERVALIRGERLIIDSIIT